ncbi:hypothetical protein ACFTWH_04300 [Streptomyces sp. NPDC057011]
MAGDEDTAREVVYRFQQLGPEVCRAERPLLQLAASREVACHSVKRMGPG